MIESIMEIIQSNLIEIISAILVGIASFIGTKIKMIYEEKVNDEIKRKIVKTVVEAVEQIYSDLDGASKLQKAQENIVAMLNEKGITITELEMNMLIESVVNGFNSGIKKEGEKNDKNEGN